MKINQVFIKVLPYKKYDQIHNILNPKFHKIKDTTEKRDMIEIF